MTAPAEPDYELQATPSGAEGSQPESNDGRPPLIGVRHISKGFGPIAALNDVSLDIIPGEIRGICGEKAPVRVRWSRF